jgi:hypothetical protein
LPAAPARRAFGAVEGVAAESPASLAVASDGGCFLASGPRPRRLLIVDAMF